MKYFKYADTLTDDNGREYSGLTFKIPDLVAMYESQLIAMIISAKTEYRPDKIAWQLYNDDKLSWVLDEINDINHISEYTFNKTIYYLPYNVLTDAGII